jgi:hypothetical protein
MWADPPACAVSEPKKGKFKGENGFPGILQNCHRYFMVFALIFLLFLWHDAWKGFWFPVEAMGEYVPGGQGPQPDVDVKFGIAIGSLVLLLNTALLTCYTLGCHSLRHFVGGRKKSQRTSLACYTCVSGFNAKHMFFAWTSLFGVMGADLYVRLVSMGVITDLRFF